LAALLASSCQKENTTPHSSGTANLQSGSTTPQAAPDPLGGINSNPVGAPVNLDGVYTGTFSLLPPTGKAYVNYAVQLILSGTKFNSGNMNQYAPIGDGTMVIGTSEIDFTDLDAFPDYINSNNPLGQAENPALFNNYKYTVKGDSLLITHTINSLTYSYKLKKQ